MPKVLDTKSKIWKETKGTLPTCAEVAALLDIVDCKITIHGDGYIELGRDATAGEQMRILNLLNEKGL